MLSEIYLDNAATTKPYSQVITAVNLAMSDQFGNASSLHKRGVDASMAISDASRNVASLVGTSGWNVIFTSGGTESDNLAILGSIKGGKRKNVVTTSVEHAAIFDTCQFVKSTGGRVDILNAGESGIINPSDCKKVVDTKTAIVSIIHVANEMCTVQPVNEVAKVVKAISPKTKVHVDAVQAAAQLGRLDYSKDVDMVSISSHKIHGPQGVGALLLRQGVTFKPLFLGGDQQNGLRPGTLNLPGIMGMSVAAKICNEKRKTDVQKMQLLSTQFIDDICKDGVRSLVNGDSRAPGMILLAVEGIKSEVLLHTLEKYKVYVSSGSACHSTRKEPSQCLVDAGLKESEAIVRLSLSYETTKEQLDETVIRFFKAVNEVRSNTAGV